jgi:hypothetical protein
VSVCFVKADAVVMHGAVINDEIIVRHLGRNFVRASYSIKECVILFHDNGTFPVVAKLVEKGWSWDHFEDRRQHRTIRHHHRGYGLEP